MDWVFIACRIRHRRRCRIGCEHTTRGLSIADSPFFGSSALPYGQICADAQQSTLRQLGQRTRCCNSKDRQHKDLPPFTPALPFPPAQAMRQEPAQSPKSSTPMSFTSFPGRILRTAHGKNNLRTGKAPGESGDLRFRQRGEARLLWRRSAEEKRPGNDVV